MKYKYCISRNAEFLIVTLMFTFDLNIAINVLRDIL